MIYPAIDMLLQKTNNDKSMLCMITAIRARQLLAGAECVSKTDTSKTITNAVNEISEGKICYRRKRPVLNK